MLQELVSASLLQCFLSPICETLQSVLSPILCYLSSASSTLHHGQPRYLGWRWTRSRPTS